MKTALAFVLAVAAPIVAASGARAQQGPGLQYFADHMTTLDVARSQQPIAAFPDKPRPFFAAPGAGRDGVVAETPSPGRAERRPPALR